METPNGPVQMRRFDTVDLMTFAGAEPFADGSLPLIGVCEVMMQFGDLVDAVVVLHGEGLEVVAEDEHGPLFRATWPVSAAAHALNSMHRGMNMEEIELIPGAHVEELS